MLNPPLTHDKEREASLLVSGVKETSSLPALTGPLRWKLANLPFPLLRIHTKEAAVR